MVDEPRPLKVNDMKRAIRGALAEGLPVEKARIKPDGTIELVFLAEAEERADPINGWDLSLKKELREVAKNEKT